LAHAFGETTGMPVMGYVRSRRLSEAARRLADGADNILDLALDYGYASHEAFSRAFRAQFGKTPEAVRREASLEALPVLDPVRIEDANRKSVKPHRVEQQGELIFIGLKALVPFGGENAIPAQWEHFMQRYGEIENKADPVPWGVNADLTDDGVFTYCTAVKVTRASPVPKGLDVVRAAPHRYAVFRHEDHVYTLPQTYAAIWNDWLPDAGGLADSPSLERHLDTFDTRTGYGGVEIWIPLA
jgi:AraC family transcriptional regulator